MDLNNSVIKRSWCTYDAQLGKMALMPYVNSQGPDECVHPCSLIWNSLFVDIHVYYNSHWPALVARLDARPTGDQEVAGSTPAESAMFFCGDLILKYLRRSFSVFH